MRTPRKRKLELNRETIRALSSREMAEAVGGFFPIPISWACPSRGCVTNACQTDACPHAPPLTSPGYCTNGCTIALY